MEKKSLGRGLEDISEIFLSKGEEQQPKRIFNGFSSVKLRDETCESCVHFIVPHTGKESCKIFSQAYEKYGVVHIDSIIPIYANFCEYFIPVTLGAAEKIFEERRKNKDILETKCEVEETVSIDRKITYPDSAGGQKDMKKTLFGYIEEDFEIRNVELKKTYMDSKNRKKEKMDVQVIMSLKSI